ncbi:MAG TPA: oxygenase MpaB family protein [Solirubrobacteraceae bacterium]|nr:oxygenase MpaB family protein [Solirubrobacteraceae bacterium]
MPGYFTDDSMLRRVIGEYAVAFSGPRALLMMAAHPVAFAGFFAHTGALGDPYARLRRTGEVLDLIAWGEDQERADRVTARVRAMHATVRGETAEAAGRFPAGTPYRADDPELLLWVLASLVDSAALVYEKYVRGMTSDEREALWSDYRVVGRHFGLADEDMPADWAAFRAYVDAMVASGDLVVTDQARELAIRIVMRPPMPLVARPLVELINQLTIGLLPAELRRQYGFRWDPLRGLALAGGAEYAKRLVVPFVPERLRYIPQARAA